MAATTSRDVCSEFRVYILLKILFTSESVRIQQFMTDEKKRYPSRKYFKKDARWGWRIILIITQKSSKGWHWPRRVVSRHPGLLGLLTWRMRFAPSRYLGLDGVRIPSLSLLRIGDSESVHSYIPSSITWLRPVFWALGTSTRIFCLALFIDQNQEQSFSINCQDVTHQLIEIWDQLSMRRGISHPQELPDSHRLTADRW